MKTVFGSVLCTINYEALYHPTRYKVPKLSTYCLAFASETDFSTTMKNSPFLVSRYTTSYILQMNRSCPFTFLLRRSFRVREVSSVSTTGSTSFSIDNVLQPCSRAWTSPGKRQVYHRFSSFPCLSEPLFSRTSALLFLDRLAVSSMSLPLSKRSRKKFILLSHYQHTQPSTSPYAS